MSEASPPARDLVRYELDAADRIVCVDDAWLRFADENAAPELTREAVLGRPLWDFVVGMETRRLYEPIFAKVRTQNVEVIVPFRCDSPRRFRFMRLVISHSQEGTLRLEGILVRDQARPYLAILDRIAPREETSLPICSLCRRVRVYGRDWIEAEDAVARLDLFARARLPRLAESVCDACADLMRAQVGEGGAAA